MATKSIHVGIIFDRSSNGWIFLEFVLEAIKRCIGALRPPPAVLDTVVFQVVAQPASLTLIPPSLLSPRPLITHMVHTIY